MKFRQDGEVTYMVVSNPNYGAYWGAGTKELDIPVYFNPMDKSKRMGNIFQAYNNEGFIAKYPYETYVVKQNLTNTPYEEMIVQLKNYLIKEML